MTIENPATALTRIVLGSLWQNTICCTVTQQPDQLWMMLKSSDYQI